MAEMQPVLWIRYRHVCVWRREDEERNWYHFLKWHQVLKWQSFLVEEASALAATWLATSTSPESLIDALLIAKP
jgi:hypothetical protein